MIKNTLAILLIVALGAFRFPGAQETTATTAPATLPNIVILATGGTIAGSAATGTQAGYTSGQTNIDVMIEAVPGIEKLANIKGEQISNIGSQDMSFEIWIKLLKRINELLKSKDCDGIVITHGTDTMEETAYFLNLTVNSDKPVVMVGSMRPSTAVSADGPLNLYNGVALAANPAAKGRGVLVTLNDDIHGAQAITKTSTTDVQTFMSIGKGLVGTINYGVAEFFRVPDKKHTTGSEFAGIEITAFPRVDIIYGCADMPADLISGSKAKGIVLAGMGNGNVNAASLEAAKGLASKGVFVVRSSRVPTGSTGRNVEVSDDKMGFVASTSLNPQKSRILLMLCMLKGKSVADIQTAFNEY